MISVIHPYDSRDKGWGQKLHEWAWIITHKGAVTFNGDVEAFVRTKLGDPEVVEDSLVWSDPTYKFSISGSDMALDTPEGVEGATSAKNLLWDLGLWDSVITRSEYREWYELGVKLAEPHIEQFPDKDKSVLKKFVLDYCDGRIFCDHHVQNPRDLGMVFLVLFFGAFTPQEPKEARLDDNGTEIEPAYPGDGAWHAMKKLPQYGSEPKRWEEKPPEPAPPDNPPEPQGPPAPVFDDYDVEHEEKLRREVPLDIEVRDISDIFLGDDEGPVREYRVQIDEKNAAIQAAYDRELADHVEKIKAWEAEKAQIAASYASKYQEYLDALADWEAGAPDFRQRYAAWEREKALAEAARAGFSATRLQNLGVIYEHYDKAGPRSVNGMPIFFSCQTLSKNDWKRCIKAITRELERREDMEI